MSGHFILNLISYEMTTRARFCLSYDHFEFHFINKVDDCSTENA